jgi:hypothetical protein
VLRPATLLVAGAADAAEAPKAVPKAKTLMSARRFIPHFSFCFDRSF